jgi:hypothetical protein
MSASAKGNLKLHDPRTRVISHLGGSVSRLRPKPARQKKGIKLKAQPKRVAAIPEERFR